MIQKDYILRMAEELAKVIARMIGKDSTTALEILDESYQHYLKMDRAYLDSLSLEEWLPVLTEQHQLRVNHLELLAGLLAEEGRLLYEANQLVESKSKIQKALLIFDYLDEHQSIYSLERVMKARNLRQMLESI